MTPGPWMVGEFKDFSASVYAIMPSGKAGLVADVNGNTALGGHPGNVAAIAAVPELIDACKTAVWLLTPCETSPAISGYEIRAAVNALRVALKKANSQSNDAII